MHAEISWVGGGHDSRAKQEMIVGEEEVERKVER